MEIASEIFNNYLPYKYKFDLDKEYFKFLAKAVTINYKNECFHFSILGLHMIYMGIIYQYLLGVSRVDKIRFNHVLIGFHHKFEEKPLKIKDIKDINWHHLSEINESTIFEFYRVFEGLEDRIKDFKKLVKIRNDLSHSKGTTATIDDFNKYSVKCLKNLKTINQACENEYKKLFNSYLKEDKLPEKDLNDKDVLHEYMETNFIAKHNINIEMVKVLSQIEQTDENEIYIERFKDIVQSSE